MRCVREPPGCEFNQSLPQGDLSIVPDRGRPFLKGPDMAPYRFQIDIESVHYYHKGKHTYCAILLRNTFSLGSRMLEYASIPLSVNELGAPEGSLDFSDFYPNTDEVITIGRRPETEGDINPNITVSESGTSVQFSDVGTTKTKFGDIAYCISLSGVRKPKMEKKDPIIEWRFKDPDGVYYPSQTKMLVVASKETEALWFPLILRVLSSLQIERKPLGLKSRFLRAVSPVRAANRAMSGQFGLEQPGSDDWEFEINGQYKEFVAREALRDSMEAVETNRTPLYLGLRAAVIGYATVQE